MSEDQTIEAELVSPPDTESETPSQLALPGDVAPNTLHILPLSERPFFPAQALPLILNKEPWLDTLKAAADSEQKMLGLLLVLAFLVCFFFAEPIYSFLTEPLAEILRERRGAHRQSRQNGREGVLHGLVERTWSRPPGRGTSKDATYANAVKEASPSVGPNAHAEGATLSSRDRSEFRCPP